jgi:hypothetical protein
MCVLDVREGGAGGGRDCRALPRSLVSLFMYTCMYVFVYLRFSSELESMSTSENGLLSVVGRTLCLKEFCCR